MLLFSPCLPARAEVPPGQPPPRSGPPGGFTLNAEVLKRYDFTLAGYNAMDERERRRVTEWIKVLEGDRLASEARQAARQPAPDPKAPPFQPKWTPAELEAMGRLKPGELFDHSASGLGGEPSPWSTRLRAQNGGLETFSLRHDKKDFELSLGDLGAGQRSPLLGPSPYFNLRKGGQGSGSAFDYGYKAQAGLVLTQGRLFSPDAPAVDAKIDRAVDLLGNDKVRSALSVPTGFTEAPIFVGSVLGHVGRAYHLGGPVDVGWSAMGLGRMTGLFPNATFDQSVGMRVKTGDTQNIGLFGGVTEAAGLFARTLVAESLASGKTKLSPELDMAPHAALAAWGKLPYLSGGQYTAEVGRQWNPWTTVQSLGGSVSMNAGSGRVGLQGSWSDESGREAEFARTKSQAGLSYSPNSGTDLSLVYGRDNARLGNAAVDNHQVLIGLTIHEKVKKSAGSVTLESIIGTKDSLILPDAQANDFVRMLDTELAKLLALKRAGEGLAGAPGVSGRWTQLGDAWRALDPSVRSAVEAEYARYGPGGPSVDDIFSTSPGQIDNANKVLTALADPAVLDRVLTRAIRSQILTNLEKLEIPLFGEKIKMSAPMVLAAAHAYSLGLRPLPAVTAADARGALDPFLSKKLTEQLGCAPGAGAKDVSACLLGKLPPSAAAELRKTYGDDLDELLKQSISWTSDIIRREINALLLQVYLAAERFNTLTVDGGERIGDLNSRAIMSSFARLDERERKVPAVVFKRGVERAEADLREQDNALRNKLTEYGRERLEWLQAQPAWPAGTRVAVRTEDWAPLLAAYGDAGLFDFILKAKAKYPGNILIELNDDRILGGMSTTLGNPTVIALPRNAPRGGKLFLD